MPPTAIRRKPMPAAPAKSVRQRRKEARPVELLDAALHLFVEKGFAATRTDEVAAAAGVSKGTLYLYFPSKEDLLKAVIRHYLANPIGETAAYIQQFDGPTDELLAKLLREWWQHIVDTPASGILKLMVSEVRNFPELANFYVDEVVNPSHRMLADMISRGKARGEFRDLPVDDLVHSLVAPMLFMAMHKHSFGACPGAPHDLDTRSFIDTQLDLMLNGLRLPSPAPRAEPEAAARAASARVKSIRR